MSKPTFNEAPVDAIADGGHFATMPRDISHVTFYFDLTPEEGEDDDFFYAKIETTDSVSDDLDTWYDAALNEILARNAEALEGAEVAGVAIKFGSFRGASGGEFFYKIDGDSTDVDNVSGGSYARDNDVNVTYSYGSLFS